VARQPLQCLLLRFIFPLSPRKPKPVALLNKRHIIVFEFQYV